MLLIQLKIAYFSCSSPPLGLSVFILSKFHFARILRVFLINLASKSNAVITVLVADTRNNGCFMLCKFNRANGNERIGQRKTEQNEEGGQRYFS